MLYDHHVPAQPKSSSPLGVRLAALRAVAKLSQEELADRAKVGRGTIANIERGTNTNPGTETLAALAKALGASSAALLGTTVHEAPAEMVEELIARFERSILNGTMVKPPATKDDLDYVRRQAPLAWAGEHPTEETVAKMIELYRSFLRTKRR